MKCIINQQTYEFDSSISIAEVLKDKLGVSDKGLAVALNKQIIRRNLWEEQMIQDGDVLLLIQATQGG